MNLPKPRLDPDTGEAVRDTDGEIIMDNCAPEDAIIHPTTGKFQSGDRAFCAQIKERADAERDLRQVFLRAKSIALATFPAGSNGERPTFPPATQAALDGDRRQWEAAVDELALFQECDERRGRERVIGLDEMSQFINYNASKGPKRDLCGVVEGREAYRVSAENRATMSYAVVHDSTGRFGPWQLNTPGKDLTGTMLPPNLVHASSAYVHTSDKGVQTGETLLGYYGRINTWLRVERVDACGKYKLIAECVDIADGHGSRYNDDVVTYMENVMNCRHFIEPAGSSGVLQALDQVFSTLHGKYSDGIKQLEAYHDFEENQKVEEGQISKAQRKPFSATRLNAIQVFAELHTPVVNWITQSSMAAACHRVGLTRTGPNLEAIPRERLRDDEAGTVAAIGDGGDKPEEAGDEPSPSRAALLFTSGENIAALPTFVPPEGAVQGTLAYVTAERDYLKLRAGRLEMLYAAPQTAAEAGAFQPARAWGSGAPRHNTGQKVKQPKEGDQKHQYGAMRERQVKERAAEAKKASEANARVAAWAKCNDKCQCVGAAAAGGGVAGAASGAASAARGAVAVAAAGAVQCVLIQQKIQWCAGCAADGRCAVTKGKCRLGRCRLRRQADEAKAALAAQAAATEAAAKAEAEQDAAKRLAAEVEAQRLRGEALRLAALAAVSAVADADDDDDVPLGNYCAASRAARETAAAQYDQGEGGAAGAGEGGREAGGGDPMQEG